MKILSIVVADEEVTDVGLVSGKKLRENNEFRKSGVGLWVSYQIRNIAGCACAGNAGNVFPRRRLQRKLLVSDPAMHHVTCVTHVPWCMSGSLALGGGENVPGIPGACAPAIFRIWQEAHASLTWGDLSWNLQVSYQIPFSLSKFVIDVCQ